MASYTALQLVNRVRLRTRSGPAFSGLTPTEAQTILVCVNEAKDYVLETKTWDFDSRHDGVLLTQAVVSTGTVSVTANTANFGTSGTDVFTPASNVARLLVGSDSVLGSTAVRIASYGGIAGILDAIWIGSNAATATYQMVFYEYVLADTVKDVTQVRFQNQEVALQQIGRDESFHIAVPRPTQQINDSPGLVVIGSLVTPTVATGGTATPGLGLLIWPCPLTRYRLEYSYTYRHPQLSASQDLENVSDAAVHDIVLAAYSFYEGSSGKDPDLAAANMAQAEVRMSKHHQMNRADPLRHRPLRSLDERSGGSLAIGSSPENPDIFEP